MLSRVAECVYWMFRYVERAENVARFLDVNYNLTLGAAAALAEQWAPLVFTTGDQVLFAELYNAPTRDNVVEFLAFRRENPNSILSCVERARENARTIREVVSSPMWEELNKFYHMVRAARAHWSGEYPYDFCNRVKLASQLLVGVTDATMSHGEAWHFGRMGRLLERADKTSRIVDVQYYILLPDSRDIGSSLDVVRWSALLKSAGALEMYRREHGPIVPKNVADFLILDSHFPRSLRFCVSKALDSLREITHDAQDEFLTPGTKHHGRLLAELNYTTIDDIIGGGLHEFVDEFQMQLNRTGEAIAEQFFTVAPPTLQAQVQ